jgi:hypothetical protein
MPSAEELAGVLAALRERGQIEVREDGDLLAGLVHPEHELREQGGKLLLHLWTAEGSLVRRVRAILSQSQAHLEFEVERFGKKRPGRLELRCRDVPLEPGRISRERFRARFRQLLAEQFPDEDVLSLTTASDLEHSFSGNYARGVQARGREAWAILGAPPSETAASADAALAFGLLWLDWARAHNPKKNVAGLRLFLPEGRGAVASHRMQALSRDARLELFELDWARGRARALDPRDAGNLESRLAPRREVESLLAAAAAAAERSGLAQQEHVDAVVVPGSREVSWRFRGLEFARYRAGGVHVLGDAGDSVPVGARPGLLQARLDQLRHARQPDAPDSHHPLYRAQAERWLESQILADPARIEPRLEPRFVYSQVPAFSFTDRAVLDVLGATRDGRLVVLELKVSEDLQLLPQALDYWLRVCRHRELGDFEELGYFPGLRLAERPPLLYLVAPGLRFHPATETLLRYVSRDVEVIRVGLNENWRQGLRVLFRQERPGPTG